MSIIIRKGNILANKEFSSINEAKRASRDLQKKGVSVKKVAHKTHKAFPLAHALRPPRNNVRHYQVFKALAKKAKGEEYPIFRLW